MPILPTTLDTSSATFVANREHHLALRDDLRAQLTRAAAGGSAEARQRHLERGKLLPRQRVEALLDPGTPFLELSPLAAHGLYDDAAPGAGLITGVGKDRKSVV